MATDSVASTLPPGYAVEPPTVATLKATDVPATHELGPNGIAPKSTLPPGYSIEGQTPPGPTLTPGQTLSRMNANMAAAMSGQPQSTPEDQANFDEGKKAGTIQGGIDIGASAVLGPALEFLGMGGKAAKAAAQAAPEAQKVGTGLLDQFGNEIFREIPAEAKQAAWKLLQDPKVQSAIKVAAKGSVKAAGGAGLGLIAEHVLHWLLSD